jgi:hypothetical protein
MDTPISSPQVPPSTPPEAVVPPTVSAPIPASTGPMPEKRGHGTVVGLVFAFLFASGYYLWTKTQTIKTVEEKAPTVESFSAGYIKDIQGGCPLSAQTFTFADGASLSGSFGSCTSIGYTVATSSLTVNNKKLVVYRLDETIAGTTSPAVMIFGKAPEVGNGKWELDPATKKLTYVGTAPTASSSNVVTIEQLIAASSSIPMTSSSGETLRVSFLYRGGYTVGIFSAAKAGFHMEEGSLVFQPKN